MGELITDWSFWAVIVAAIAVLLSQLPPVRLWFKASKLDIDLYSRIFLSHNVGNPTAQIHLIISNTGGKLVRIRKINLNFIRNGNARISLPALNYYTIASDKDTVIFTPFNLPVEEEWSHITNFLNLFNRDDDRRFRDMVSVLRQDIFEKRQIQPDNLVEGEAANVAPIVAFFNEKFAWLPGEYQMEVEIIGDDISLTRNYRFTIFESESNELRSHSTEYKYGARVYWEPSGGTPRGVFIQIHESDT